MSDCPGKNSWPEVVGWKGEDAAAKIERENTAVDAIVIEDGTLVTGDFRCDRVRVWVDDAGRVVRTPGIGGKKTWPELVAKKGERAAAVIERQNRNVNAIVVHDRSPVTVDFRCDRVWVWVNAHGVVTRAPTLG